MAGCSHPIGEANAMSTPVKERRITINKLGKHLGAEVGGVDLSQPLDDNTFSQISNAFFDSEVVVFRNQKLTPEQQIAFTRRFGVLEQHVRKEHRLPGYPEILIVSNVLDESGKAIGVEDAGRFWHSDLSYKQTPSMLSALYALEVPVKDGVVLGHTSFASTTAAYEALSPDMKKRLAALKNVHSYVYYRNQNIQAQRAEQAQGDRAVQEHVLTPEHLAQVPDAEMPIVRTHPVTGKKGLFINEAHTSYIAGLPKAESDKLLKEICQHIIQPEFRYEHRWQKGDLLMWDNIAVQHKANFDYRLPLRRLMHRTTVRGTAPF
jgi:taurine dioxygenase